MRTRFASWTRVSGVCRRVLVGVGWIFHHVPESADTSTIYPQKPLGRPLQILASLLAVALPLTTAHAVTLTWAKTSGTWDTTSMNWTGSTGLATWPAASSGTDT